MVGLADKSACVVLIDTEWVSGLPLAMGIISVGKLSLKGRWGVVVCSTLSTITKSMRLDEIALLRMGANP